KTGLEISSVIGETSFLKSLSARDFTDEKFGQPTVEDIIHELDKPGRDPRPEFKTANFKEGVENLKDLETGMVLEGVVTNVTNFGAFVDIGVHQDGLVHISALADKFVKDTRDVVKAGDLVKVKVMEVDIPRKRIALTMRLSDDASASRSDNQNRKKSAENHRQSAKSKKRPSPAPRGAMAEAFAKLGKSK
ncbi:MAG: S1 RNA-binding domain-containing protein, partial [Candidatus Thiodiazotropha sp. 6PLUC3]